MCVKIKSKIYLTLILIKVVQNNHSMNVPDTLSAKNKACALVIRNSLDNLENTFV